MTQEIWKPIAGYEGIYEVSNCGNVRSVDRYKNARDNSKSFQKGKTMTPQTSHKGYRTIILHKDGKAHTFQVHRLVAMAFIPNSDNKPQVNHIDCNKKNNHVENLEWVTQEENMKHASENGIFSKFNEKQLAAVRRNQMIASEYKKRKVAQLSLCGEIIRCYESLTEAERVTGTDCSKISMCCKGKRKSSNGFKWKYIGGE
jgi:DNA gyrase/topoisomerase IV subunit A